MWVTLGAIRSTGLTASRAIAKYTVQKLYPNYNLLPKLRDVEMPPPISSKNGRMWKVGKYVCDFPRPEFQDRENVISMPHIGASSAEAEENCAMMAADQLRDFLENGNITNSVNFPNLHLELNHILFDPKEIPHKTDYPKHQ